MKEKNSTVWSSRLDLLTRRYFAGWQAELEIRKGLKSDGIVASVGGFSYGLGWEHNCIGNYMNHSGPKIVPCARCLFVNDF